MLSLVVSQHYFEPIELDDFIWQHAVLFQASEVDYKNSSCTPIDWRPPGRDAGHSHLLAHTTLTVSFPGSFTSIIKRDCRSTGVAMYVFCELIIRSSSSDREWPDLHLGRPVTDGEAMHDLPTRLACHSRVFHSPHPTSRSKMSK
jgi:hypothetical protein